MHIILLAFAFVSFFFAAVPSQPVNWNRAIACGLAFLTASMLPW